MSASLLPFPAPSAEAAHEKEPASLTGLRATRHVTDRVLCPWLIVCLDFADLNETVYQRAFYALDDLKNSLCADLP